MPDRRLDAWETYSSGPIVSIRAGGPLDGVVTIAVVADGNGRLLAEATWTHEHEPHAASRVVDGYDLARALAQQWADQLAGGTEPPSD